jgi:hypothetical protein
MFSFDPKQAIVFVTFLSIGFIAGFKLMTNNQPEQEFKSAAPQEVKEEQKTPFTTLLTSPAPLRISIPLSNFGETPMRKLTRQNAISTSAIPFIPLPSPLQFNEVEADPLTEGPSHMALTPHGINPYELPACLAETPTYTPVFTPEVA